MDTMKTLSAIALIGALSVGAAHAQTVLGGSPAAGGSIPMGSIYTANTGIGTTAATVATLPAATTQKTYICGFAIDSDATAVAVGNATITGVQGGTMTFRQATQAVASGTASLNRSFIPCLPSTGANVAIVVTSAAGGTGGNTTVNVWGYNY